MPFPHSARLFVIAWPLSVVFAGCAAVRTIGPLEPGGTQLTAARSANASFNRSNRKPVPEPFARNFGKHRLTLPSTGWAGPDFNPKTKDVYLGDNANNTVTVYKFNGTPIASLNAAGFSFPWAIAEANKQNLKRVYVGNSNLTITVFLLGSINNTPSLTLTQPACCPLGMTFDAGGNLYAGEFPSNVIDRWTYPTLTPASQVSDPNLTSLYFLSADKLGNLFADGFNSGNFVEVDESTNAGVTWTALPISGISFPGGLEVDASNNLIIADQSGGKLYTYAPPGYGPSPSSTFVYANGSTRVNYSAVALKQNGLRLWAANLGVNSSGLPFGNGQPNKYPVWNIALGATPPITGAMPLGIEVVIADAQ